MDICFSLCISMKHPIDFFYSYVSSKERCPSFIAIYNEWSLQATVLYSHDTITQIYRCREIRNTDDSPLFRYETFINFLTLVFRHEESERETQFLLCWLYYQTQQTRCASRSPQLDWPSPVRSIVWSQLTSCSKSPNSQPITSGHDVIHTPVLFPIWGFYYDVFDCHILCARAWTVLNVCAPALRAE